MSLNMKYGKQWARQIFDNLTLQTLFGQNCVVLYMMAFLCERWVTKMDKEFSIFNLFWNDSMLYVGLNLKDYGGNRGPEFLSCLTGLTSLNLFGTTMRGHHFQLLENLKLLRILDMSHTFLDSQCTPHVRDPVLKLSFSFPISPYLFFCTVKCASIPKIYVCSSHNQDVTVGTTYRENLFLDVHGLLSG